jgi:hypothetical protein
MTAQIGIGQTVTPEEIAVEFQKLDLVAGDVLVMRFAYQVEPEILKELSKRLYEALPAGVSCVVVDPSIELEVQHTNPVAE